MTDHQTSETATDGPQSAPDGASGTRDAQTPERAADGCTAVWIEEDDGSWSLPVGGGLITVPRWVTGEERARLAEAWFARRTARAVSAPDTPPSPAPAGLRERIAHAIAADDGHPWDTLCADTQQHYLDNADAVLAVRDRELEQLRADRDSARASRKRWMQGYDVAAKQRAGWIRRAVTAEAANARARVVEEHWRRHFMASDNPGGAHALAMVRAALDGETDPNACGLPEEAHAAFLAALDQPAGEASDA